MKNRKIGFKLDFSLLQQTCEFRGSTVEIFSRRQRQFQWSQERMQDKNFGDCSLDWIESFEFGQEFEELMPKRSTNIAPLSKINFKNSLSFELDLISFCLSLLTVINNNNNNNNNKNNFSSNNLTKDLNL